MYSVWGTKWCIVSVLCVHLKSKLYLWWAICIILYCDVSFWFILEIWFLRSSRTGMITFTIIDVLFSRVMSHWCVISTFAATIFIALLNDFALLASTSALIPFMSVPPIAAPACKIVSNGTALLSLDPKCNCTFLPVAVAGPFEVWIILLGKRASKVSLIFFSKHLLVYFIMSISSR